MRFFKRFALLTGVMIVALAAWGAFYAYDKGFTKKWRRAVHEEFQKRGIEADIGKLTLDPFEGLVARDVRLYLDPSRRNLLAEVSRVSLDIDVLRLFKKEFFLNTIDIRNADLSLPVDPADEKSTRLDIKDFNARILMPENRIEISQAHGDLHGVHINLRGSLFKPSGLESKTDASAPGSGNSTSAANDGGAKTLAVLKSQRKTIHTIVTELEKLQHLPDNPPVLTLTVNGDLDDPDNLTATMQLSGTRLSRDDYECNELNALIELNRATLTLKELILKDDSGELTAQANYTIGDPVVHFKAQSSIDLHRLASHFVNYPALGEVIFYEPPEVYVEGEYHLEPDPGRAGPPLFLVGSLQCNKVASRGVIFEGLNVDFGVDRDLYYLRNIKLTHETGASTGTALVDAEGIKYEAEIKMDPRVFMPFVRTEGTRKFLGYCGFNEESTIFCSFRGTGPELSPKTWTSTGEIDVRNLKYNDVPVERAELDIDINGVEHVYRNVRITRKEGTFTADEIQHHTLTKVTSFDNAVSTVWPTEFLMCFAHKVAEKLKPYRFSSPPECRISGVADPLNRTQTDLHLNFSSNGATNYTLLGATLPFQNARGALHFKGDALAQSRLEAGLFGGQTIAQLAINNLSTTKNYSCTLDVKAVRFEQLSGTYSDYEETKGELTGFFDFTGHGDDYSTLAGKGKASITNGNLFSIPLLGPLSPLISDLFKDKKAGHSIAREASASFVLQNGTIATEDFEAHTNSFRIRGSGSVNYAKDIVDFHVRMNAKGAPGILLFPVSMLLEYSCEGTMSDPVWRAKNIPDPGRMLEKAVNAATGD
ncbi:MAG: AsmA-like C-terminal region-containing protein [Verrucomicrobiota bacterium]